VTGWPFIPLRPVVLNRRGRSRPGVERVRGSTRVHRIKPAVTGRELAREVLTGDARSLNFVALGPGLMPDQPQKSSRALLN
jgi:hypothetical protein